MLRVTASVLIAAGSASADIPVPITLDDNASSVNLTGPGFDTTKPVDGTAIGQAQVDQFGKLSSFLLSSVDLTALTASQTEFLGNTFIFSNITASIADPGGVEDFFNEGSGFPGEDEFAGIIQAPVVLDLAGTVDIDLGSDNSIDSTFDFASLPEESRTVDIDIVVSRSAGDTQYAIEIATAASDVMFPVGEGAITVSVAFAAQGAADIVPAPSSAACLAAAGLASLRRRR